MVIKSEGWGNEIYFILKLSSGGLLKFKKTLKILKIPSGGFKFLKFLKLSKSSKLSKLSSGGAKSYSTCQQKLFIVIAFIFKSMSLEIEPMAAYFHYFSSFS